MDRASEARPEAELSLIAGGALITSTPEQDREPALKIARHTGHDIQPELAILKRARHRVRADRGGKQ